MTVLPLDPAANRTPAALRAFLQQCQAAARVGGRGRLVSISIEVEALDPLAVLESIFEAKERHFYVERPDQHLAVAGAEAVLAFSASGPDRFEACRRFVDDTLERTIAVGDMGAPFAGPHVFCGFTFFDSPDAGEPFEGVTAFVPRWQVGRREGRTVAVANFLVEADTPLDALAGKVWRAHQKFQAFGYSAPDFAAQPAVGAATVAEAGGADAYVDAVGSAVSRIGGGGLQKVVLARAKDLHAPAPFHPLRVLNGLRQRFPDCYSFSLANGRGQSFIGASPERLVRIREGTLLTEAQAGTIRRGETASEDAALAGALLRDEKELREHRVVVDSIAESLGSLGIRAEFPARPVIRRLANVQHLYTPMHAPLPAGSRLLDVLGRLHPTPAVGGIPRQAAAEGIRSWEAFPRGLYAGAIGWIDSAGDGEFIVGLRSALIDGARARIYAGNGIVAGSRPEREFAETEWKFRAMQEALLG